MTEHGAIHDSKTIEIGNKRMREIREILEALIHNYENRSYEFYSTEYALIKEAKKALKEIGKVK